MGKKEQIEAAGAIIKEALAAMDRAKAMIVGGTGAVLYNVAMDRGFDGKITIAVHHGLSELARLCGETVICGETSIGIKVKTMCIDELRFVELL